MRSKDEFENYVYSKSERKRKIIGWQNFAKTSSAAAALLLVVLSVNRLASTLESPLTEAVYDNSYNTVSVASSKDNEQIENSIDANIDNSVFENNDDANIDNSVSENNGDANIDNDEVSIPQNGYYDNTKDKSVASDKMESFIPDGSIITFANALSDSSVDYQLPDCLIIRAPLGSCVIEYNTDTISKFCVETLNLPFENSDPTKTADKDYSQFPEYTVTLEDQLLGYTFLLEYNLSDYTSIEIKDGSVNISYSEISVDSEGNRIVTDVAQKRTVTDEYIHLLFEICNTHALFDELG